MSDYMFVRSISSLISRESHPVEVNIEGLYNEIGIRSHGKGIFHKNAVLGKSLGDKRIFKVIPNCIVFNIVFAWEQALAITSDAENGFVASHRFPMYSAKSGKVDLRYLRYYFLTKRGKSDLELASPGGAGRNKTLGQKEFEKLKIKVPDFVYQEKIADILSTWDKSIKATERLLENSKKRKKALMQQLLTGKKRLLGCVDEWTPVPLSSVAKIEMGSSPSSEAYNESGIGLPLIQGNADIKERRSKPRVFTSEVTKEAYPGDILMSVRAPVGEVSVSDHHCCIGRGVCSVRADESYVTQEFLFQILLNLEPTWDSISQGSTFESVNSRDIKNLTVQLPSIESQIKIAQILTTADLEIESIKKTIDMLVTEKSGLTQQLLTGKKRVKLEEPA